MCPSRTMTLEKVKREHGQEEGVKDRDEERGREHAFCQALYKGIEKMSRAVGLRSHRRPRKQKPSRK